MWHFMWRVLNWVFGFGICHIRHINIDNECFRIYFTCRNNSASPPLPQPQLTHNSPHLTSPRRTALHPLLTTLSACRTFCAFNCHFHNFYIFEPSLSSLCVCLCVRVCACVCLRLHMPTRQLSWPSTHNCTSLCVCVCVCRCVNRTIWINILSIAIWGILCFLLLLVFFFFFE